MSNEWQTFKTPREVIEKLLAALEDEECAALLVTRDDLDVLIIGIDNLSGAYGGQVFNRAQSLLKGLLLLRRQRFGDQSSLLPSRLLE